MKIGIMGGTFDPIHNGHLHLAQTALTQFDLDQIWFMPNGMPPHKKQSSIESDIHERIAMTRIAIKANKQFYLQEYEAKREKVSYSYKTMPLEHVSSHEIRKLIESGEPVSEYIPAEVEAYIRKEGLYGSGNRKNQ